MRAAAPEVLLLLYNGPACKVPRGALAGDHEEAAGRVAEPCEAQWHQRGA